MEKYKKLNNLNNINNPWVRIYVNKIENRIAFKIKTGYSLELLTSETMKWLGCAENKITKDKSSENVPYLEITKVVLVHCNIVIKWLSARLKSFVYICFK